MTEQSKQENKIPVSTYANRQVKLVRLKAKSSGITPTNIDRQDETIKTQMNSRARQASWKRSSVKYTKNSGLYTRTSREMIVMFTGTVRQGRYKLAPVENAKLSPALYPFANETCRELKGVTSGLNWKAGIRPWLLPL